MFDFSDNKFNDGSQFEKYIGVCLLETLKKYVANPNEYIEKDFKYKDYVFDYYLKNLPKDFENSIWSINNKNVYLEVKKNLTPSSFNRIRRVANDDIYIVIVCMNRVASKYSESNKNILILDNDFESKSSLFNQLATVFFDCVSKSFDDDNKQMVYILLKEFCNNNPEFNVVVTTDTVSDSPVRKTINGLNPLYRVKRV